jgi:hypothetical protein
VHLHAISALVTTALAELPVEYDEPAGSTTREEDSR